MFIFINFVKGLKGVSPFKVTLPAKDNGLSNQVFKIGPPYTSVFSFTYLFSITISGAGLTLKEGESVWAPINLKPSSSISPVPISKAIIAESFFIT